MAAKRRYNLDDQATALAALQANGGNLTRTARELGIPASTLRKWRDGKGLQAGATLECDQKKAELDGLFEQAVRVYLGRALDPVVVEKVSGRDAIIAAATATDKMRLLREQPTAIEEVGPHEQFDREALEADLVRLYPAPSAAPDSSPARPASDAPRLPVAEALPSPALPGGPLAG